MASPRIVCLRPPANHFGAARRYGGLLAALRRHGWVVDEEDEPAGLTTARAQGPQTIRAMLVAEAQRLSVVWSQQPPDLVHLELPGPASGAWAEAARRLGIPCSASHHPVEAFGAPAQAQRTAAGILRLWQACRLVLAETPAAAAELAAAGVASAVLPSGYDPALWKPQPRSATARAALGVAAEGPLLVHLGRLIPPKNPHLLAQALAAARSAVPATQALIAGDGPARPTLANALPWARFLPGADDQTVGALLAQADVFVFPSMNDSFGLVVAEAAACGCAPLAFRRAAAGAWLDEDSAWLVEPGDEPAFIAAAVACAQDPAESRRRGHQAAQRVADLAWAAVGSRLDALLREALGPCRGTR